MGLFYTPDPHGGPVDATLQHCTIDDCTERPTSNSKDLPVASDLCSHSTTPICRCLVGQQLGMSASRAFALVQYGLVAQWSSG